jgi:adenosylmethionine-8-amino-7-oxononanoate aminotransferase
MMTLAERDQQHIWHPYTQHQMSDLPIPITRGKGAYLFDQDDKPYLDLVSSWWVTLHGHAQPEIAKAIYEQAMTLEHVIFSGFTHEPAVALAEKLLAALPDTFTKVFYTDNGSTAIETALKMTYQYWRNQGEMQRKRFIAFENSYHGDTFGAMALGKKCGFFSHFEDLLFSVDTFAYPSTWMDDADVLEKEQAILDKIHAHLELYAHETAALIIEPLVQGAGGMRMCSPRFLLRLETLVRQYGVLIIYDEVMTGFGRTGDLFACLKAETTPDIICLAKGITGGFLPLAATVCHERIYQAFLGDSFARALAHGHSFTANPLGCAAALASLAILQQPETLNQIAMIERNHQEMTSRLLQLPGVEKVRYCGTIMAFDLTGSTEYGSSRSLSLRDQFLKHGLIIRPLGNVIYLLPPYCISESELQQTYKIVIKEIEGVIA